MLVGTFAMMLSTTSVSATSAKEGKRFTQTELYSTDQKLSAVPKTFEATIKMTQADFDKTYSGTMIGLYKSGESGILFDIAHWGPRIYIRSGNKDAGVRFDDTLRNYVNQEVHIAVTIDPTAKSVKLYVNGAFVREAVAGADTKDYEYTAQKGEHATAKDWFFAAYSSLVANDLPYLTVGGDHRVDMASHSVNRNGRYFNGTIYSASVFSDVRTANEVAADKNGMPQGDSGLLAWYDISDMANGVIPNKGGSSYALKFDGKAFMSGFNNVYSSSKQVTSLPKSLEATIYVPSSADDQYWGNILAWNNDKSGYDSFIWDIQSSGSSTRPRLLFTASGTCVIVDFQSALDSFKDQVVHLAVTIGTDIKLYINGTLWSGTPTYTINNAPVTLQRALEVYGAINISKLPLPTIGGDHRANIPKDGKTENVDWWAVWGFDNYRWFRGKIYSAAAFTDVRTASEIAADKVTLPAQGADNLLMSYDLAYETAAKLIPDKSGNGYNMAAPLMWLDAKDKTEITDYSYSFAVVGDTQIVARNETEVGYPTYSPAYKGQFDKIYDYIVNNAESKNIKFSFHMGDVTDHDGKAEWELAMKNIAKMNGIIPNNIVRGNHDGAPRMTEYYTTAMFKSSVAKGEEYGFFDGRGIEGYTQNTLNAYQTITVGDVMYLMLSLDLGPCKAVVEWANEVIEAHPYHNVIITTHSYLQGDNNGTTYAGYPYMDDPKDCAATQYNPGGKYGIGGSEGVNYDFRLGSHKNAGDAYLYQDATYMLNNLVKKHKNISMVLCGHECSEYIKQMSTTGDAGNTVLQFLIDAQKVDADLQAAGEGHSGTVAMFYFSKDGKKLTTEYYSTIREQYLHDSLNVNTYDVSVVEVPEAVKSFYTLMHSLDSKNYTAANWRKLQTKLAEVKQLVVTSNDVDKIGTAVTGFGEMVESLKKANADTTPDTPNTPDSPTTDTTDPIASDKPIDESDANEGCGSAISFSAAAITTVVALGTGVVFKRKRKTALRKR